MVIGFLESSLRESSIQFRRGLDSSLLFLLCFGSGLLLLASNYDIGIIMCFYRTLFESIVKIFEHGLQIRTNIDLIRDQRIWLIRGLRFDRCRISSW